MNDKHHRRILDRPTGTLSLLATGSRITGDIETPGALMIGCHVCGDGNVGGELSVSAEAHWEGDVHAHSAVIAGRITGAIVVRKKIEIAATAVIRGRVIACSIALARGATIEGEVTVTGDQPILEYEERRVPANAACPPAAAAVPVAPVAAVAGVAAPTLTTTR